MQEFSAVARSPSRPKLAHHRLGAGQELWIGFGGHADQLWLRLLRPGFRHCFAALRDATGWIVLDPLSGRLLVTRLDVPATFDLPHFWRRAGCSVMGPYCPANPRVCGPWLSPYSCVSLCRALLGPSAPRAWTPRGLFEALEKKAHYDRKIFLTRSSAPF